MDFFGGEQKELTTYFALHANNVCNFGMKSSRPMAGALIFQPLV
jgi:hypothetical protein